MAMCRLQSQYSRALYCTSWLPINARTMACSSISSMRTSTARLEVSQMTHNTFSDPIPITLHKVSSVSNQKCNKSYIRILGIPSDTYW